MYCPNPECPDFKATGVPGEFVEGVTVCPYCESRLVEQVPVMESVDVEAETERPEDEIGTTEDLEEDLVVVATFNLRQDAEAAISYLMSCGIDVYESSDDWGGTDPAGGFNASTRLLTLKSDAEKAITALKRAGKEP